jgi:glycosyltransferase involved in cell wall biosynthesis
VTVRAGRRPIHVAFHYLGCARTTAEGVALPSFPGSLIECLAGSVERVTVVAYDPPPVPRDAEDETTFVTRAANIDVLSLGPKGSRWDARERKRRVRAIVSEASPEWDLLVLRLGNRRAHLVFDANRCARVATIIGGHTFTMLKGRMLAPHRFVIAWFYGQLIERRRRRMLRGSGITYVNSRHLIERYEAYARDIRLLHASTRSVTYSHRADDRLDHPHPRFLVVGRIERGKGVLDALEVFDRLQRGPLAGAHLDVVGIGGALEEMERSARARGLDSAVSFRGWVSPADGLYSIFRNGDVLLHLSHAESVPSVVWEALAHSVLVVCTPVGGLAEFVQDRREVLFVPPGDVDAAERAVLTLLGDPELRRPMLERGYVLASDTTLERVVDSFLSGVTETWPELRPQASGRSV